MCRGQAVGLVWKYACNVQYIQVGSEACEASIYSLFSDGELGRRRQWILDMRKSGSSRLANQDFERFCRIHASVLKNTLSIMD